MTNLNTIKDKPQKKKIIVITCIVMVLIIITSIFYVWKRPTKTTIDFFKDTEYKKYGCSSPDRLAYENCYCKCIDSSDSIKQYNKCVKKDMCGMIN